MKALGRFFATTVARGEAEPLTQRMKELAFQCLHSYVKWHLGKDEATIDFPPIMDEMHHGKFLNLPFKLWLHTDPAPYEEIIADMASEKIPCYPALLRSLGNQYMPPSLIQRLTGLSQPDVDKPLLPLQRYGCMYGKEYVNIKRVTKKQQADDHLAVKALSGMIACYLQSYFYNYLCQPCELISTFNHPAAQLELADEKKLAVGVFREVLILPQYGSMHNFWSKHAKMVEEGGNLLGYHRHARFHSSDIFKLLQHDPDASAMYQLCLDVGLPKEDFDSGFFNQVRFDYA